ncbi:MAG: GNAT family N-acetyltransferase [Candidatus Yanofskybacteria bacterium]|nr:GNAT family N-acetyltransferase [Candidatus Yanofskybacteria bacterium]
MPQALMSGGALDVVIREAERSEWAAISEVTVRAFNEPTGPDPHAGSYREVAGGIEWLMRLGYDRHAIVAVFGGSVIGGVLWERWPPCADAVALFRLGVLPEYRNRGIGALLVGAVERAAQVHGYTAVVLKAMLEKGLPEYYARLGFTVFETRAGAGGHEITMLKRLVP